jgi:galactonate dehydratase
VKIANVETFLADAGWRPWAFVKVTTDQGVVGYGEASCPYTQLAVLAAIEDFKPLLIGADPRPYEMRFWDLYRRSRLGSIGGVAGKAIGAIECALIDIKARSLGVSVAEMFGGPTRDRVPLYWSHFLVNRSLAPQHVGARPVRTLDEVADAGREVTERGFRALKTNIFVPGDPPRVEHAGFGGGPGTTDQVISTEMLRHTERLFARIRDAVGPDVEIILDLNWNAKPESVVKVARALEPYDLAWIELDIADPDALRSIKQSVKTAIASSETLFYAEQHLPFLQRRAVDVVMIDVAWNGFAQAKKVADLCQAHQTNICPHNYYSHLATFIAANFCAALPNVRIMEYDVDDVPWRDDYVTRSPEIVDGEMKIPTGPGWGTELDEAAIKSRPWRGPGAGVTVPSGWAE